MFAFTRKFHAQQIKLTNIVEIIEAIIKLSQ